MPRKPPCLNDDIVNPATGYCIGRNGKIGKRVLAQIAQIPVPPRVPSPRPVPVIPVPVRHVPPRVPDPRPLEQNGLVGDGIQVKVRKGSSHSTVILRRAFLDAVLVRIVGTRAATSLIKRLLDFDYTGAFFSTTVEGAKQEFEKVLWAYIGAGYKVSSKTGTDALYTAQDVFPGNARPQDARPQTKTPPRTNTRIVDVEQCKNKTARTLISMNLIQNIEDKESLVMLGSGNCYIVDEIASDWIARGIKDLDSCNYVVTPDDMDAVLNHPRLPADVKKRLQDKLKLLTSSMDALRNADPQLVRKVLAATMAAGLLCIIDYSTTATFVLATRAMADLNEMISRLPSTGPVQLQEAFRTVVEPNTGRTLNSILSESSIACIHGIGYSLFQYSLGMMKTLKMLDAVISRYVYYEPTNKLYAYAIPQLTKDELPRKRFNNMMFEAMTIEGPSKFTNIRIGYLKSDNGDLLRFSRDILPRKVDTLLQNRMTIWNFFLPKVYKGSKDSILDGLKAVLRQNL